MYISAADYYRQTRLKSQSTSTQTTVRLDLLDQCRKFILVRATAGHWPLRRRQWLVVWSEGSHF
jgi:hypothetical protein